MKGTKVSSKTQLKGHLRTSPLYPLVSLLMGILFQSWDLHRLLTFPSPGEKFYVKKNSTFPLATDLSPWQSLEGAAHSPGVKTVACGVSPTECDQSLGWWLPREVIWRIPVMKFQAGVSIGPRVPIHSRIWAQSRLGQAWSWALSKHALTWL